MEGVVIVGSILLAFGIEAWWDGMQERAEEQVVLLALQEEFTANITQFGPANSFRDCSNRLLGGGPGMKHPLDRDKRNP